VELSVGAIVTIVLVESRLKAPPASKVVEGFTAASDHVNMQDGGLLVK
jgi:hypothetical protein